MRRQELKILLIATLLGWGSSSQAVDIFGRHGGQCQTRDGKERCGHGPDPGDAGNAPVAFYTFDPADITWDSGRSRYRIKDHSPNANDLLIHDENGRHNNVFSGVMGKGVMNLYDPVTGSTAMPASFIDLNTPVLIQSINNLNVAQCKASNEVTVEAWVLNDRGGLNDQLAPVQRGPLKIVSMSGASNNGNFFLGHNYVNAGEFQFAMRTGNRTLNDVDVRALDNDPSDDFEDEEYGAFLSSDDQEGREILAANKIQHIMMTHEYSVSDQVGTARMYVSSGTLNPKIWTPTERDVEVVNGARFSGWGDFKLNIGNEATAFNDGSYPVFYPSGNATTEDLHWRGRIFLVAVYCRGFSKDEVLGGASAATQSTKYKTDAGAVISKAHLMAMNIYRRINGVGVPIGAPIISGDATTPTYMALHVKNYLNGLDQNGLLKAAEMATQEDNFYNVTVRDMVKRMSVRNETVATPLNDMVATFIGVTRDDLDARQLLTGNFLYAADPELAAVPNDLESDMLRSNNHYEALEREGYNLKTVLKKFENPNTGEVKQFIFDGNSIQNHPDPAGVLTSRAFMAAHADAGTNRRLVEYTFREFMCLSMEQWANSQGPDEWIGADVARDPGGDTDKFKTNCRGCHSNMDGFRGAFAKFNYSDGFVKYADHYAGRGVDDENAEGPSSMALSTFNDTGEAVALKLNRNPIYSNCTPPAGEDLNSWCTGSGRRRVNGSCECKIGKEVKSNQWVNNANLGLNESRFGWRGKTNGRGVREFAKIVSDSDQFSRCMTRRVFRAVCKREPLTSEEGLIDGIAGEFRSSDALAYNLRRLFARVAVTRECTGN